MIVCEERYHVPHSQVWPNSRGGQEGRVHLHVMETLDRGRFKRQPGEALCSKKRGTMERPPDWREYRCETCAARAERYGIVWPSAVAEGRERMPA